MAFPTSNWFRQCFIIATTAPVATSTFDWNASPKAALFTDTITGTFAFDTDTKYGTTPWDANEVVGSGYTAAGQALATPTCTISPAGTIMYDADDTAWTTSTITARGSLSYDSQAGSLYALVAHNFGGDFTSTAGTFTIAWNALGLFTIA